MYQTHDFIRETIDWPSDFQHSVWLTVALACVNDELTLLLHS